MKKFLRFVDPAKKQCGNDNNFLGNSTSFLHLIVCLSKAQKQCGNDKKFLGNSTSFFAFDCLFVA